MSRLVANIKQYYDAKLIRTDIPRRPVGQGLIERLDEYFSIENIPQTGSPRMLDGTNICMIRPGMIVSVFFPDDGLCVLVGRECGSIADISPSSPFKTPGGNLEFSLTDERSVKSALIRETRKEENFKGRYGMMPNSTVPMGVVFALPHGVLQFYSGKIKNPPEGRRGKVSVFREPSEKGNDGLFITYYSIDDAVKALLDQKNALIRKETAEMIVESYFWKPSRQLRFKKSDFPGYANKHGNLKLPQEVRSDIFRKAGISTTSDFMDECEVYYTVNTHSNLPLGVKVFLMTDLFMYQHEFGPEALESFYQPGKVGWQIAEDCVKHYLNNRYPDIVRKDLYDPYIVKQDSGRAGESCLRMDFDKLDIYRRVRYSGHYSGNVSIAIKDKK